MNLVLRRAGGHRPRQARHRPHGPLAEAWDSGAGTWDAKRREAYANDQDAPTSLVAVTTRTNRSKADQDPSAWMPPLPDAHCRYIGEWTATKPRWGQAEIDALNV
ncbi:hypothetical protein EDD98_5726 [Streptomyces sp. PanSC19]|nr:hypothetical protein EDD98_5726 [Streptomyces sp. PanSC19]